MTDISSTPEQAASLRAALDLIRAAAPHATFAWLTTDQDDYGFTLRDIEFPDGRRRTRDHQALIDSLIDGVHDLVHDLDWDGVVGEDQHGLARLPLRIRPQAGDAARLTRPWPWAAPAAQIGDLGVLSGPTGTPIDGAPITFNAHILLDDTTVTCSARAGGPRTTWAPVTDLTPTEDLARLPAQRWTSRRIPAAKPCTITVPIWNWIPRTTAPDPRRPNHHRPASPARGD